MTTLQPAAAMAPHIATIVPENGATRHPDDRVAHTAGWIASGHYGPYQHNPESTGKLPETSSESGIMAHPPTVSLRASRHRRSGACLSLVLTTMPTKHCTARKAAAA